MTQVTVNGWVNGLNKVQLNHLLRQQAGLGLAEAKHAVDMLLAGEGIACTFPDIEAATAFAQAASALGAVCSSPVSILESGTSSSTRDGDMGRQPIPV
jgi:ribosomal protein L7/L12